MVKACLGEVTELRRGSKQSSIALQPICSKPESDSDYTVANLIQLPAGQTIQSCTFELQRVLGLPQAHHIVTITAVTPTTNIGPDPFYGLTMAIGAHQTPEQVLLRFSDLDNNRRRRQRRWWR